MVWVHMAYPLKTAIELSPQVRSRDNMLANINSKAEVVVDARSAGRFVGSEPEPRAGVRGGHIPGAGPNQPTNQPSPLEGPTAALTPMWLRPSLCAGSHNVPFPMVLEASGPAGTMRFKAPQELRSVFSAAGADLDGPLPLVGSCGSGLTACVLALAAHHSTGKLVSCYGVTLLFHALCHPTSLQASVPAHRLPSTMARGWSGAAGRTLLCPRMAIDQFTRDVRRAWRAGSQLPREAAAVPQCPVVLS